eukprot:1178774-Prorocentrum_minimum.AAC.1
MALWPTPCTLRVPVRTQRASLWMLWEPMWTLRASPRRSRRTPRAPAQHPGACWGCTPTALSAAPARRGKRPAAPDGRPPAHPLTVCTEPLLSPLSRRWGGALGVLGLSLLGFAHLLERGPRHLRKGDLGVVGQGGQLGPVLLRRIAKQLDHTEELPDRGTPPSPSAPPSNHTTVRWRGLPRRQHLDG